MTLAALLDAGVDADAIRRGLDSLGLQLKLKFSSKRRCGIAATHIEIETEPESTERHLPEIEAIIGRSGLTAAQKDLALRIFRRLGDAEAQVHGIPIERVHFH